MEFSYFTDQVSKVKNLDLAGEEAHQEMWPATRKKKMSPAEIEAREPLNAGVIALFYPNEKKETMLILILRKTYKGVHSGQIGFPGGREEVRDKDIRETALRETYEEVGVRPTNITILRRMTRIYIPPSNFYVYPFLGICKRQPQLKRQESEIEELLPIPLEEFLDGKNRKDKKLILSSGEKVDVPAFTLQGQIVWGATGMMLNEVKSLLVQVL